MCVLYFLSLIGLVISLIIAIIDGTTGAIWGIILSIIGFIIARKLQNEEREKEEKKEEQAKLKAQSYEDWKYNQYQLAVCSQNDKYGNPDKRICIETKDITKDIAVWGKTKQIYIFGEMYSFSDILNCSIEEEEILIKGKIEYTSKTTSNTGSTIGRAVVGGLIAGPAGAIIGGSTSSKKTETIAKQEDDIIVHKYYINIGINNLSNPNIRLYIGENCKPFVNEIYNLINVVINNKN